MRVWKKEEIPGDLHYTNNDRITDILLNADNRWDIEKSKAHWENVRNTILFVEKLQFFRGLICLQFFFYFFTIFFTIFLQM